MKKICLCVALLSLSITSIVCGGNDNGDTAAYEISGTVLVGNSLTPEIVLQNNAEDDLTVNGTDDFTFPTRVEEGEDYDVTVKTTPAEYNCIIVNGSGTMNGSNVTNVSVTCSNAGAVCGFSSECTSKVCEGNTCQ